MNNFFSIDNVNNAIANVVATVGADIIIGIVRNIHYCKSCLKLIYAWRELTWIYHTRTLRIYKNYKFPIFYCIV